MKIISIFRKIKVILLRKSKLCRTNVKFKDVHRGQRCFILCNGPSVNKQELAPLKNEIVFSVSNGYYHKDYSVIQPKYHCVPGLSYGAYFRAEDAVAWFKEMDQGIGDAGLFLDVAEEPLISKNHLFPGRRINYLCMGICFSDKFTKTIDISGVIPAFQSVPIMCLMVAIYMGFKEIYLIGTEHDSSVTGEYRYFYTPKLLRGKDYSVSADGKIKNLKLEYLYIRKLMAQYRILGRIGEKQGVAIYNATLGGNLEVFPRVNLSEILSVRNK